MGYHTLHKEFPIEPLRDEAHLGLAIEMLDRLVIRHLTEEEGRYLDHLANMVCEYETAHYSFGFGDKPIKDQIEIAVRDLGMEPEVARKVFSKKPVPLGPLGRFMDLAVAGKISASDIDDWVESWHEGAEEKEKEYPRLYEYLGMTEEEYVRWVVCAGALENILDERRAILTHTEGLTPYYIGAWWKRGNVYRPAPQRPLNPFLWVWLWLTGWRSAHWRAPLNKWKNLNSEA
jgi:hypothetical protein